MLLVIIIKLKKATTFMRIGVNSDLNIPVRRSALKHNLGSRAVKLPHSGVETQNNNQENKAKQATENPATADAEPGTKTVSTSHENNLNVLIIIAGGLAWFLFR